MDTCVTKARVTEQQRCEVVACAIDGLSQTAHPTKWRCLRQLAVASRGLMRQARFETLVRPKTRHQVLQRVLARQQKRNWLRRACHLRCEKYWTQLGLATVGSWKIAVARYQTQSPIVAYRQARRA